jgi:hypothetical protein
MTRRCGCGGGFGQLPQTDEEMVEWEMRRSDDTVQRADAASQFSRNFAIEHMATGSYFDKDSCHRWKTNNAYPPDEVLAYASVSRAERRRCGLLRAAESQRFLQEYRRVRRGRKRDPEEMYEMRAAFGPGETVVDVITGERTRLPGRKGRR